MGNYTVYMHTCPNGKRYIGITKKIPDRRWQNGTGYKTQILFYRAIQKYGWDNIEHEILFEGLTEQEAKTKEIELIAQWKTNQCDFGYNLTNGGDGTSGCIPSEETRLKMSNKLRERIVTDETKQKLRQINLGKNMSAESIEKMRESAKNRIVSEEMKQMLRTLRVGCKNTKEQNTKIGIANSKRIISTETKQKISHANKGNKYCVGRVLSEETKSKISNANKGKTHSEEAKSKMIESHSMKRKGVIQIDPETLEVIREFRSAYEAEQILNIKRQGIGQACKGKIKTAYGYIWKYAEVTANA